MTETTEQAFENTESTEGLEDLFNNIDLDKILELIKLFSNPPTDKNVNFLLALKPLLSEERAPKVEKAVKILKMYDIYQKLKESGMLSNLSDFI
jgi:hypothetical protein